MLTEAVGLSSPFSSFAILSGQVVIYIKYKRKNTSFLSLINLNGRRAQHDLLSKKMITTPLVTIAQIKIPSNIKHHKLNMITHQRRDVITISIQLITI